MDFKQLVENRHQYAKDWQARTGGKVVGYHEMYFPEELAYAAGLLPVRILARHEPDDISTVWIYASCYPVRDFVNQYHLGRYDYLDAMIHTEGCEWMYNAFEVAMNTNPNLRTHYLFVPRYPDAPTSRDVVVSELKVLKSRFEEWYGKEITDEALFNAIDVYNTNRELLRRITELRRAYRSPILGSEYMQMLLADQVMDKAEMNVILEEFLKELEEREPYEDRVRLMIIGSETWDSDLEELVESLGANVVIDELDNGTSYFWNQAFKQKDPLMTLALRCLGRPHSAIRDSNWRRRPEHIFELTEDFAVDGVLIVKQIYCVSHGSDTYAMWKMLRERKIPYHFFERDTTLPEDETRQRLESFINMLKPGLIRLRGWHQPRAFA
jgi:benzoyl-CoA reductase subunit C